MSLDLTKLKKVKKQNSKTIAQCPACAEDGGDSKGEHLVVYPDGRYGCVVENDAGHRKRIWELAGTTAWKQNVYEFEVKPYQMPKRQLVTTIGRLGRLRATPVEEEKNE